MNVTLLEKLQTLQHQAKELERGMADLREELAHVTKAMVNPSSVMARYIINGETYEITQADVEAVAAGLLRPHPESAIYELALVKKVAKRRQGLPRDVQFQHFFETVEAVRAEALENGTAIEDDADAAIDD